jgi:Galactose oxidase, central domain
MLRTAQLLLLLPLIVCSMKKPVLEIPPNTWTMICKDDSGARRSSALRYVPDSGYFLLWGFMGYITEYYGNPEKPYDGNSEYDMVAFYPKHHRWQNHFPLGKQREYTEELPPMHMCSYYQGITIGSHRPQLKVREGTLRPDLNIVFDQVTFDSHRKRMVYFTGGRTFAYDIATRKWLDICNGRSAPPVLGGSLCYDPVSDIIVLAGGGHVVEKGPDGELTGAAGTWLFDCETGVWSSVDGDILPPDRIASRLVYDSVNKVMVTFGGDNHTSYLAETWIFDPAARTWRRSSAKGGPPPRAGHFTVYDPSTQRVIVGGGFNRHDLIDMWAYDVSTDSWEKLTGKVPTGFYINADIMPEHSLILLTTATKRDRDLMSCNEIYPVRTTYAYRIEPEGLVDRSDEVRLQHTMLKRAPAEMTVGTEPDPARRAAQLKRIESMPANRWVEFDGVGRAAPLRTWGSCSFDPDSARIVYWGGGHCGYGGNEYDFYDVKQNTWIPSPVIAENPEHNWDKSGGVYPAGLMFSGAPFMRHGRKAYAWDPVSRRVINMKYVYLTAGYEPELLANCQPMNPDFGEGENFSQSGYAKWVTWTYDPGTERWELFCPALPGLDLLVTTPRGVMGINYYWRAVNSKERYDMVHYEGKTVVENSVFLLDLEAQEWRKLTTSGPWPQNLYEMTALVHDSRREQLILHGGGPERDELWRFPLDKGKWEKIEPRFAPGTGGKPPVCRREAVYLPDDDVYLTAGAPASDNAEPGLWAYRVAENRWYRVDIEPPEGKTMRDMLGQNRAWTYDPIHDMVFMILGERDGDVGRAVVYGMRYDFGG